MYKYIGEYPKNRRNGWQVNIQGVCHDDNNWFFSQTEKLWKFPVTHDLNKKVTEADPDNGILMLDFKKYLNTDKVHIGDIDYCDGYIFAPIENHGKPYIAVFSANDLSFITKQVIKRGSRYYEHLAWCAVNPNNKCLYTSDGTITYQTTKDQSQVIVYTIDFNAIRNRSSYFLKECASLIPINSNRCVLKITETQGGCFDNDNNLYITNGYGWLKNRDNSKFGIGIFQTCPINNTSKVYTMKLLKRSNSSGDFKYQFKSLIGEEVEGITYWDLNNYNNVPEIKGCLHAIMLDNDAGDKDDLYFKHYDKI